MPADGAVDLGKGTEDVVADSSALDAAPADAPSAPDAKPDDVPMSIDVVAPDRSPPAEAAVDVFVAPDVTVAIDVLDVADVPALDRPDVAAPIDRLDVVAPADRPDVVAPIDRPDVFAPDIVDVIVDRGPAVDAPDAAVDAGVCAPPRSLCGTPAECVDTGYDAENCGRCGVRCAAGNACSAGACVAVIAIDGGEQHTCARLANGTVMCWGHAEFGQLGEGSVGRLTVRGRPTPVAGLTSVQAISVGRAHACALRDDGTVWCWGANGSGQVGTGAYSDAVARAVPVAGVTGAVAVAAGWSHSCAIVAGGAMRCWGSNAVGQLGSGSTAGSSTTPVAVTDLTGVTAIAAGNFFTCAIVGTTVRCWGSNGNGQLGATTMGSSSRVPITVSADLMRPTAIAAGSTFACVNSSDGHTRCWGEGRSGQFGNSMLVATPTPSLVSVPERLSNTVLGDDFACSLGSARSLCWGSNRLGQVPNGLVQIGSTLPAPPVGLMGVQWFGVGASHGCARTADGRIRCWGAGFYGQHGSGAVGGFSEPQTVPGLTGVAQVVARDKHTCVRMSDRTVRCTGSNESGLLGDGTTASRFTYAPVTGLADVVELAGGAFHSCARSSDGTARCWGDNRSGQCGDDTTMTRMTPVAVGRLTGITQLSLGQVFSCALLTGGTVRCWGGNGGGTLGRGYTDLFPHASPEAPVIGLTNATQIASALFHSCALRMDGTVMCWGGNDRGQLGDGTTTSRYVATTATGLTGVTKLSGGYQHTCARRNDGTVWCWGFNNNGQCGVPTSTVNVLTPTRVPDLTDVVDLTAGDFFTCALRRDASTWCWGANGGWQLGGGTPFVDRPTPALAARVPASSQLSAGSAHACALGVDGALRCWGGFEVGQLGTGHLFAVRF